MSIHFFMSHASRDNSPEVDQFYKALCDQVQRLTGCLDEEAGFIDKKELKISNQWDERLTTALNESHTIVLLLSARCIHSEGCGKELRVFLQRLQRHRYTGCDSPAGWSPIFPVLWSPWEPGQRSEVLNSFQWNDPELPPVLRDEGLFYMMQMGDLHRSDYVKVVHVLAKRIYEASKTRLAPLDVAPVWHEIPDAFNPSAPRVQISTRPPQHSTYWRPDTEAWSPSSPPAATPQPKTLMPALTTRHRKWALMLGAGVLVLVPTAVLLAVTLPQEEPPVAPPRPTVTATDAGVPALLEWRRPPAPTTINTPPGVSMTPIPSNGVPVNRPAATHDLWGRSLRANDLLDMNAASNFPSAQRQSGFTPDPWELPLTAGGGQHPVEVSSLFVLNAQDGRPCGRSYVTRNPDFHLEFAPGLYPLLRFYVVTDDGSDATLLINAPDARWHCNDDHGHWDWSRPLMPTLDFHNPQGGRYDVWVGSYDGTGRHPARLFVTEVRNNHP